MLALTGETDDAFIRDKVVADFGCGPCGSLAWAKSASIKLGIDVLVDKYVRYFLQMMSHGMIYVKNTESAIPIPADFVDIMYSLNAIDHVDNFPIMCKEILRVIKPGGMFCCSFNLEEPATVFEPQRLTEQSIKAHLLDFLNVETYRLTTPGPCNDEYRPFFDGTLNYSEGQKGVLWVKAIKPRKAASHL